MLLNIEAKKFSGYSDGIENNDERNYKSNDQTAKQITGGWFETHHFMLFFIISNSLQKIRGAFNKFPDFFFFFFFVQAFKIVVDSWKIQYVTSIHLIKWLTNFYDFRFKWTATAAIGIHPTKALLSLLVNFKNAIWQFRRTICNKILFLTWKICHRNVWNASDSFWSILNHSSISFRVA